MKKEESIIVKIKVIDSIMGTGKTSWAIQEMLANPDESYIYCTPFLDEVRRIKEKCKHKRKFYDPQRIDGKKIEGFNHLLESGKDIVLTHSTFSNSNQETLENLAQGNYCLILDEVLDILVKFNDVAQKKLDKGDPSVLVREKFITVDDYGRVTWIKDTCPNAAYSDVERLAKSGNLFYLDHTMLVWQFPPQIFKLFKKVYVLTYLFEGSFLKPYFEYHNLLYDRVSVNKSQSGIYSLVPYSREQEQIQRDFYKGLIKICNNESINDDYRAKSLSKTWYERASKEKKNQLQHNIANFVRNIAKAKASEIMWSCPKAYIKALKGRGYTQIFKVTPEMPMINCPHCNKILSHLVNQCPECGYKISVDKEWVADEKRRLEKISQCFVPCNARSSNDFADRWVCAYAMNMYPNPYVKRYFTNKNAKENLSITVDEDYFALGCMLQWIWRSRIRNNKPIHVYIPSARMKKLLMDWLDSKM